MAKHIPYLSADYFVVKKGIVFEPGVNLGDAFATLYAIGASTRNTSYTVLGGGFIFRGSSVVPAPTSIKAVAFKDTGANTMDVRIFDVTNALVIAELTGISDDMPAIQALGALANIPTGEAIWEVQARRVGNPGSTDCFVDSISIL